MCNFERLRRGIPLLYRIWRGDKGGQSLGRPKHGLDRSIGRFVHLFIKKQGVHPRLPARPISPVRFGI